MTEETNAQNATEVSINQLEKMADRLMAIQLENAYRLVAIENLQTEIQRLNSELDQLQKKELFYRQQISDLEDQIEELENP